MARWRAIGLAGCIAAVLAGCADRQHRNPFDPLTEEPGVEVRPLEAVAGDGEVVLRWDYSHFEDIEGYRLYRRRGGGEFALYRELDARTREWADLQVENGVTYEYWLALLVRGEGERPLEIVRQATPGPQVGWAADAGSGLVWKISPDNRTAFFGQGRFPELVGMGLNRGDGSCWVSDRFYKGVFRISAAGQVETRPAAMAAAGPLSIDAGEGIGWLIDPARQEVYWFPLAGADSLQLNPVDARFERLAALEAREGNCWIADADRVLRYGRDGGRQQWGGLDRPGPLAVGPRGMAWALVRGGQGVARLAPDRSVREFDLPFGGRAVEVDPVSGACWVAGEEEVAALGPDGTLLAHWQGIEGGRGLAVDGAHQQVWIATSGMLLKFSMDGELLSRLGGFASLGGVEVNPGSP